MTHRLVDHINPEGRPTPLLLLASLRDIDPTAELVYVGEGQWWLGSVRPNEPRAAKGRVILQQMEALQAQQRAIPSIVRNIMLGKLMVQGFARIMAYDCSGDVAGEVIVGKGTDWQYRTTVLADFAERDRNFRETQGENVRQQQFDDLLGVNKKKKSDAEFQHFMETDGRAHYRREVKNRVTFGRGGMTGGAGRLIIPGA